MLRNVSAMLMALAMWSSPVFLFAADTVVSRAPLKKQDGDRSPAARIPYPGALDSAAIAVERLDRLFDDALILGNGDVNALLYAKSGRPQMILTKNDVWDARLITENDPALPKLEWIERAAPNMSGGGNNEIHEDGFHKGRRDGYHDFPYPFPKPCARLVFGEEGDAADPVVWKPVRAQGQTNDFSVAGDNAVMRISGKPGVSCGYAVALDRLDLSRAVRLRIRLSGTENAKYFIDVLNADKSKEQFALHSLWQDTPTDERDCRFDLVEPDRPRQLILYAWSDDGKPAENRVRSIIFEDAEGHTVAEAPLNEQALTPKPEPKCSGGIDVRRAVAHVLAPESDDRLATVRALIDRNVFLIQSSLDIRIAPTAVFDCDPPRQGRTNGVQWLVQDLPGDGDWPGMTYAVALAAKGEVKTASIVTSLEAEDPLAEAIRIASETLRADRRSLVASHERKWEEFWAASGVELDDPFFSDLWYRNLYFLRCVSAPGVECVGLYAGSVTEGCPAWHGNHTLNYNAQQTFWSAYPTNHVELAEPYVRLIHRYMPRARWLCRQIFDFDGAFIPHVLVAHEPEDPEKCVSRNGRQYIHHVWGFTMGVSAFSVQDLWRRYKYAPDREFLETTAYPAVRDVALFQANFMDRCEPSASRPDRVVLAPSVSPEHWGWTKNFERNRNSTFDIAMFHYVFQAAVEGAEALGRDRQLAERFKACIKRLPDYPTWSDADRPEPVVVDVWGAPPITYNIAIPAVPVFPGDQVTWFSPDSEKNLFARSIDRMKWNGNNSSIITSVARLRLGMPGCVDTMRDVFQERMKPNGTMGINRAGSGINRNGHYTEQFGASMAVCEMLLQSVGGAIRVFPAWPPERNARFTDLRAQGGFLVSAENKNGRIQRITIRSTVGGPLRLLDPWKNKVVTLDTAPNEILEFHQE